jgi:hypothetical protein
MLAHCRDTVDERDSPNIEPTNSPPRTMLLTALHDPLGYFDLLIQPLLRLLPLGGPHLPLSIGLDRNFAVIDLIRENSAS